MNNHGFFEWIFCSALLVFTPVTASLNCLNCESVMTPNHQCEELIYSTLASCGQAVNFGSEPPVTTHKSLGAVSELKPSQSELRTEWWWHPTRVAFIEKDHPTKEILWSLIWADISVQFFLPLGFFSCFFSHYSSRCIVLQNKHYYIQLTAV